MKRMEEHQPSVHLSIGPVGHILSADCWCEPSTIMWIRNINGVIVRIVEHNDETTAAHQNILNVRDHCSNEEYANYPDAGWITRLLNSLDHPPRLVPPPPQGEN